MKRTDLLQAFVRDLLTQHRPSSGGSVALRLSHGDELAVEQDSQRQLVRICYYVLSDSGERTKDLELVCLVASDGTWVPSELYRARTGQHVYARRDPGSASMTVMDPVNQEALAAYCDGWSFHLREQG